MTFAPKQPTLTGKMGSFKEDIEKILARKAQEQEALRTQYSHERILQDSLKKEFEAEREKLKAATEITVLPLLEAIGKRIDKKPILSISERYNFDLHTIIKGYNKVENDTVIEAEVTNSSLRQKTVYFYPEVLAQLTFIEPVEAPSGSWNDGSPGRYLSVFCFRKQKRNYAEVIENREVITIEITNTDRLEKYILAEFERLI